MSKETITWVYVCDPPQEESDPKDGRLYVARTDPESLRKDSIDGWYDINQKAWWYEVDKDTLRIKQDRDDLYLDDSNCTKYLRQALMLDLSNIPVPTMDDEKPIVVIQTISQSINYYIEE